MWTKRGCVQRTTLHIVHYLGLEVLDAGQADLAVAAVGATGLLLDLMESQTAAWYME